MLASFQFVGTQVIILFLLLAVGFACRKLGFLTEPAVRGLTNLMLYVVTPCMLINAFQRPFEISLLRGFLIATAVCIGVHLIVFPLSRLLIRDKDPGRCRVLRFGACFANCGYMGLPLLQALFGSEALFYGAAYNALFTVLTWTHGLAVMCGGGKERISLKKAFINPGTLSVIAGLVLFFASVTLPPLIAKPVEYLASMNVPVPMLIIGYYLGDLDIRAVFAKKNSFVMLAIRLVLMPLITLGGLWLIGIRGTLLVTCVVASATPVATVCTMFATKYDQEPALSAGIVAVSTLCSVVTLTLVVGLANAIAW